MEPRERCVCAIYGVDQVVRILTPYEARSRSLHYDEFTVQYKVEI